VSDTVLTEDQKSAIYDVASKNAPPSVGFDILWDLLGFEVMDVLSDYAADLLSENPDLEGAAKILADEVLRLADEFNLAPFDGTLTEFLEDGETEEDWLIREDLLPFLKNWQANCQPLAKSWGKL
jgi:hypothetical protein